MFDLYCVMRPCRNLCNSTVSLKKHKEFLILLQPKHYFLLSTLAAILTIILKTAAWKLTGSVGLLSDALESFVNLAAAIFGLWMIVIAKTPPDEDHPLGHSKAEYFSSAFEGILIIAAAIGILYAAIQRLFLPVAIESIGIGLIFSGVSTVINLVVGITLRRASVRFRSIALEADAKHLMTDVWTSVGVVLGLTLVHFSGWMWLDPLIALFVGLHILFEGARLMRISALGLLDTSLPAQEIKIIEAVLNYFMINKNIYFENLRTRRAGAASFVYMHVIFPRDWNIVEVHDVLDEIETAIEQKIEGARVLTHPEPRPKILED